MKLTYTFLLLLSLFTVLIASECRKTTTPEFYFKCKVDGQEYIPNSCANCMVGRLLNDTTLIIFANRGYESIGLGIYDHPVSVTRYKLDNRREANADYDNSPIVSDIFKTDSINVGELQISTLDKTNKIISGSFYFRAYNAVQNKIVNISEGTFRLKYKTD